MMKISVNDQEVFTLSDIQKKVIQNDIHEDDFEADMQRRVIYILQHKYDRCLERLKQEWLPKLAATLDSIPTKDADICNLIFSQPDYKNRKIREIEAKAAADAEAAKQG